MRGALKLTSATFGFMETTVARVMDKITQIPVYVVPKKELTASALQAFDAQQRSRQGFDFPSKAVHAVRRQLACWHSLVRAKFLGNPH